ncbi:MAG: hypothetical protein GX128_05020 [Bacteroidales bacterium]|nr:hypothetical protein [Bacteroidales bacterium]
MPYYNFESPDTGAIVESDLRSFFKQNQNGATLFREAPVGLRVGICQIFYKHTTPSGFSMVEWKHGGYNNFTPSGFLCVLEYHRHYNHSTPYGVDKGI